MLTHLLFHWPCGSVIPQQSVSLHINCINPLDRTFLCYKPSYLHELIILQ